MGTEALENFNIVIEKTSSGECRWHISDADNFMDFGFGRSSSIENAFNDIKEFLNNHPEFLKN